MKSAAATVTQYLEGLPEDRRAALAAVRALIKKTEPALTESMQHGMPTYSMDGTMLLALASQKQYMALYVLDKPVVDKHRAQLGKLDIGKGCIRFRKPEDLPADVTAAIVAESVARWRRGETEAC